MIDHLRGREKALERFGWTGRRAEWIALACLHGGVFTRAQWTSFLGCHHEHVSRAVHALVAQGAAIEENPPGIAGIGRVCRIYARTLYRPLGAEDIRRRRITSKEVLMRRLLAFDYVLDHPQLPWLPTEPEKMAAFEALSSWGAAHPELWEALWDRGRGIEIVVGVRTTDERGRTETVLANWARDPHPSEFDHEIGREIDRIDRAIIKGDVRVLMEYGGLQAAMKRSVALSKRAHRQAGRGLMQRTDTWRTVRLVGARFR